MRFFSHTIHRGIKRALWLAVIGSTVGTASAQFYFSPNSNFPTPGVVYSSAPGTFINYGGLFSLSEFHFANPGTSIPLPAGTQVMDSFFDISYKIDFFGGGSQTYMETNSVHMQISFNHQTGSTRFFDTEMLSMNLTGIGPGGPFMIRESPTLASHGMHSVEDVGGGLFKIDSFFDVFTELSVDGGQTWIPGQSNSEGAPGMRVTANLQSVPEPFTMALGFAAIGLGAIRIGRKRKS